MLSCRDPPAGRIKALLHVPVREWTQAWKHAECIHSANAGGSSGITEENFADASRQAVIDMVDDISSALGTK